MKKKNKEYFSDLGLGAKIPESSRMINQDGTFNVVREGKHYWAPYHSLVSISWSYFLFIVFLAFFGINLFFGVLFWTIGLESIAGIEASGSFLLDIANTTFFSIQTFTTLGYGTMSPTGFWTHVIASLDSLIGLMAFALVTGLIFARFAKPKAQILVSHNAIIAPFQDGNSFQFRIVNKRNNKIIDLEATVVLSWVKKVNGEENRAFANLALERQKVALFPLNWTIVHPITKDSPLHEITAQDLHRMKAEFIVMVKGFDDTYSQMVHLNSSFTPEEVIWGVKFQKMYFNAPDKSIVLHLDKINDTEPVGANQRLGRDQMEESAEGESTS